MIAARETDAHVTLEALYRREAGRVRATLLRLLGDFDLAEEAMHEAFTAAARQWPTEGVPANPFSWLVSTGRFGAIDRIRRDARFRAIRHKLAEEEAADDLPDIDMTPETIADDQLRLIFSCCHPVLPPDARIAMALREICGLTTEAIAHAFLAAPSAIAQRIVRAKARIRDAGLRYEVPGPEELPQRLEVVLQVVYLIFNEGYAAASGTDLVRADLCVEAIRLGRLLAAISDDVEVRGLLALMLLQDSRRAARTTPEGDMILLEDQDRTLWDESGIAEGRAIVDDLMRGPEIGTYAIQAAIAAEHARAPKAEGTDWARIADLYDLLLKAGPSEIVELNRAVAIAMRDGCAAGLEIIDGLLAAGKLDGFAHAHAARADLLRRLGRVGEARAAYERAVKLSDSGPELRFLKMRLAEIAA